jgi:N-acetylmuramoyl-L-alanine amidase
MIHRPGTSSSRLPQLLPLLLLLLSSLFAGSALAATTVVLDAGHGGFDKGGVPGMRLVEKHFTLDVARRVRANLQAAGIRTVMTRSTDTFVELRDRCAIANRQPKAVFVSIHFNAAPREGACGIETYYYRGPASASLAAAIHREVVRRTGAPDRGVRTCRYYVLRNTRIPAVLAELGFLTNKAEGSRISSSAYRDKLAQGIARPLIARYAPKPTTSQQAPAIPTRKTTPSQGASRRPLGPESR